MFGPRVWRVGLWLSCPSVDAHRRNLLVPGIEELNVRSGGAGRGAIIRVHRLRARPRSSDPSPVFRGDR